MGARRSMLVSGPLAEHAEGYRAELVCQGYKPRSVSLLVRLLGDLSDWMHERGYATADLSRVVAEEFVADFRAMGGAHQPSVGVLDSVFGYLERSSVIAPELPSPPSTPVEVLVEQFRHYLRVERGVVPETVAMYTRVATTFLAWQQDHGQDDVAELTAEHVVAFVTKVCPTYTVGWARQVLTAVRSFLRFAHLEGLMPVSLAGAVPSVASWSASSLPRGLAPGDVDALLGSCDRRRPKGRRDYAILVLLIRLGLRSAEVAALRLDDMDWRSGEIVIRGKGGHHERLPLPADVGAAVADYLHRGRPESLHRDLFLRVRAPINGLARAGVASVVHTACRDAGITVVGPHRLRHTAATEMLRAGATLPEVAQVLRHHSGATTAIYAKVDHLSLRQLALPWPTEVTA